MPAVKISPLNFKVFYTSSEIGSYKPALQKVWRFISIFRLPPDGRRVEASHYMQVIYGKKSLQLHAQRLVGRNRSLM
jgi:hypothetical protein